MNCRITIQKGTETPDGARQRTVSWADWFTCWAKISPLRGGERIQAGQIGATFTDRVTIWRNSTTKQISPQLYRIKYGKQADASTDRILDINSVANVREQNAELELLCTEAV
jgi:SPP1 family predicted phage head-tail adaptor